MANVAEFPTNRSRGEPATRARAENEHLRNWLLMPPDQPSWGPKAPEGMWKKAWNSVRRQTPDEEEQIDRNHEYHRRIAAHLPLYVSAAVVSFLIAIAALFVDYHIIQSDVWTRALANEFGVVPDSMTWSVVFKSLQVVFATLAMHLMIKLVPGARLFLVVTVFLLTFVMVLGMGFVVANNNLAAGASGVREVQSQQLSALEAEAAATSATPVPGAASRQPQAADRPDASAAAPVVNIDLQDWFVFKALPESWRKNAQVNLWLIFVSVIFFIVTAVAALYLHAAERNFRNILIARDFKRRHEQYNMYRGLGTAA